MRWFTAFERAFETGRDAVPDALSSPRPVRPIPSSADRAPSTAVIIVSWNTRELLSACLRSLLASDASGKIDIVVVDNASSDGSPEMVAERFPSVQLIANAENRGFAAATNQGIAATHGRLVLLLNSDTQVMPDAIDELAAALESDPALGAVGARLVDPDGRLQPSCSRAPTAWREAVHVLRLARVAGGLEYPAATWRSIEPVDVDVIQGACMMVRREVIDAAGGLDEGYFMYSEETEWCERIRAAGWRLAWVPAASVVHHGGGSTRLLPSAMFARLYSSKVRFLRRNRGAGQARAFKVALALAASVRLLAAPLAIALHPRDANLRRLSADYARLLARMPGL